MKGHATTFQRLIKALIKLDVFLKCTCSYSFNVSQSSKNSQQYN